MSRVRAAEVRHVVIGQHRPPANSLVCKKQATPSKYISLRVETCLVLTKEGVRNEDCDINGTIKRFNKIDAFIIDTIFKDLGE